MAKQCPHERDQCPVPLDLLEWLTFNTCVEVVSLHLICPGWLIPAHMLGLVRLKSTGKLFCFCFSPCDDISGLSRPLGTMERIFYTMGLSFSVVTFVLKAEVQPGKKITSAVIQKALQLWQKENPSLQVKVEKSGSEFWFVPLSRNIPYEEVYSDNWLQELHSLSNEMLPEGILCRTRRVIGKSFILLIQVHHSLFDGLSFCAVLTDLSDIINDLVNEKQLFFNKTNQNQLYPPWEDFAKEAKLFPTMTALIFSVVHLIPKSLLHLVFIPLLKLLPENKEDTKLRKYFASSSHKDENTQKMIPLTLEKKITQNLVKLARQHKATIFGVMSAAMRIVLEEDFKEKMGIPMKDVKPYPLDRIGTSVGLRRYFNQKVPENYLGLYVIIIEQSIPSPISACQKQMFWNMARSYSEDIHRKIKHTATQLMSMSLAKVEFFDFSKWKFQWPWTNLCLQQDLPPLEGVGTLKN